MPLGIGAERLAFIVGHGFRELEIAVVVENGVEGDGCPSGGLEMSEVFKAAAGAAGKFLRTGEMLAAVGQGFRLLLELSQLLQMMRGQAYQMALAGHGDLQSLTNPPGGISRQPGSMAHVESVDGLHQPANRFRCLQ